MFNMLTILALIIAAILSTQTIATIVLIFLFREMTQCIRSLYNEVNKKKAEVQAGTGWGDW